MRFINCSSFCVEKILVYRYISVCVALVYLLRELGRLTGSVIVYFTHSVSKVLQGTQLVS